MIAGYQDAFAARFPQTCVTKARSAIQEVAHMISLGLDPHPGSHTVVALSVNGASLASIKVSNTPDGLAKLP